MNPVRAVLSSIVAICVLALSSTAIAASFSMGQVMEKLHTTMGSR